MKKRKKKTNTKAQANLKNLFKKNYKICVNIFQGYWEESQFDNGKKILVENSSKFIKLRGTLATSAAEVRRQLL